MVLNNNGINIKMLHVKGYEFQSMLYFVDVKEITDSPCPSSFFCLSAKAKKVLSVFGLFLFLLASLKGQIDSVSIQEDLIQGFIENLDDDQDFDYSTLYEELEILSNNPINLNNAEEEDLRQLMILTDIQILELMQYLTDLGDLISLKELQAIPSFDLKTIKAIAPFVTVNENDQDYQLGIAKMLTGGKSVLFTKWRRVLEDQKGYLQPDVFTPSPYEGDPNRLFVRYRYAYENKLRIGFTAEKDSGESFFKDSNKNGFDFYTGHIHLREYNRYLEDVVLGDFTVSLGQGLILHNDFGSSKSAFVMNIKKGGRAIKSYNSINEINYFRGIGMTLNLNDNISTTLVYSSKNVDGNTFIDSTDSENDFERFSSIITSGYHRTQSEIADKNSIKLNSMGGKVQFNTRNLKIAANALYERFNRTFDRNVQLYNQFQFSGNDILNLSLDYSYRYQNLNFFGESAMSDNGGMANLHGLLIGLDRKVDLSILYRSYDRDYQVFNSNAFGETASTNNESGIYTGFVIRPLKNITLSAYVDFWKHSWLRFRRDAPSTGKEYLLRIDYYKKRKYNFYTQYKFEQKYINEPSEFDNPIDKIGQITLHRLRFHLSQKITKSFELRNRAEFSWFDRKGSNTISKGFLIYQDLIYKPIGSPISFTARYALFDADTYDNRIYTYENDLIYEFFIPFYYYRGKRYYINMRYDISRNITAEFRYAKTILDNQDSIGSGNELINGPERTELKAQVILKF